MGIIGTLEEILRSRSNQMDTELNNKRAFIDDIKKLSPGELKVARFGISEDETGYENARPLRSIGFHATLQRYVLVMPPEPEYVPFETHQEFAEAGMMGDKWLAQKGVNTAYSVYYFNPGSKYPYNINGANFHLKELFKSFEAVDIATLERSPCGKLIKQ